MRAPLAAAFTLGFAAGMTVLALVLWSTGHVLIHQEVATATTTSTSSVPDPLPAPVPATAAPMPAPASLKPPNETNNQADRMATAPHLAMPIANIDPAKLTATFNEARAGHAHEALDIMAPRGTPVMAADEGNVAKLFTSKQGGLTVYQFDNSQRWCYYYAHLDRYAPGLKEGVLLRRGDVLGFVGSTGDASTDAPHLHFAVFQLGPEKKWWQGTPIDPLPLLK
jgi:peptidoglycan LD-endopeptidase LytH